jgi:hypothetical protein
MVWLSSVLVVVLQSVVSGEEANGEAASTWQPQDQRLYKDLSHVKLELGEVDKVILCLKR